MDLLKKNSFFGQIIESKARELNHFPIALYKKNSAPTTSQLQTSELFSVSREMRENSPFYDEFLKTFDFYQKFFCRRGQMEPDRP